MHSIRTAAERAAYYDWFGVLALPLIPLLCFRTAATPLAGGGSAALQLENSRLRQEIDRLKARLPALGLSSGSMQQQQLRRTGSDVGQPGVDLLREQLAQVRAVAVVREFAYADMPCGTGGPCDIQCMLNMSGCMCSSS
jgi:hypothetical protein